MVVASAVPVVAIVRIVWSVLVVRIVSTVKVALIVTIVLAVRIVWIAGIALVARIVLIARIVRIARVLRVAGVSLGFTNNGVIMFRRFFNWLRAAPGLPVEVVTCPSCGSLFIPLPKRCQCPICRGRYEV